MTRIEEYRRADGSWTQDRHAAIRVAPSVVALVVRPLSSIPPSYFVATAAHESSFAVNERDTEQDGFQSWGIFQVSTEEAHEAGVTGDLLELGVNARVMAYLADRNRRVLRQAAGLNVDAPDPEDMGAYLAIAHNQGLHAAEQTIHRYGLDWASYKRRNHGARIIAYGDDCLTVDL